MKFKFSLSYSFKVDIIMTLCVYTLVNTILLVEIIELMSFSLLVWQPRLMFFTSHNPLKYIYRFSRLT